VFQVAFLRPGETLLVHGGSSGIGTMAIQLGKAIGAHVAVTAGSAGKLEACRALGADTLINYRDQDFVQALGPAGADVILDVIGAKYLDRNLDALAVNGRLIIIGMQGGITAELNLAKLMAKRAAIAPPGREGRHHRRRPRTRLAPHRIRHRQTRHRPRPPPRRRRRSPPPHGKQHPHRQDPAQDLTSA
jgi:NADPH:quinone reductase-like Zn-dependent oxidoreductase